MPKFSSIYTVVNHDMGRNYRMSPLAAVSFFEDVFAKSMTQKYLAAFDVVDQNLYWIITEFEIQFVDILPFWSEQVQVDIWVSERSRIKIYSDFTMSHRGKVFAKGSACWLIMDAVKKRPSSTEILEGKIETVNELALGEHKKFTWMESENVTSVVEHPITLSDIDFNNHVNNKVYLRVAMEPRVRAFGDGYAVKSINVRYFQECYLDETLVCKEYQIEENKYSYKLEKNGADVCNVIVEWQEQVDNALIKDYPLLARG